VGLPVNDAARVLAIESELEQARTALSALEEARATERLAKVEADLLAHPYLPQATFLMGECLALMAQAARERDPQRAARLDARRQALEGPRAPAFGELSGAVPTAVLSARAVNGLAPVDELELDGARLAPGTRRVELGAGLHHVRVLRHGRVIFATFAGLEPEQPKLELAVPPLVPCSADDLEGAEAGKVPTNVTCERWAMVRAEAGGGIGVALCSRDRCGAFAHWQRQATTPFQPLVNERDRTSMPAWAGFAVAGAALLATSGLVLWQAGAFERGHATATSWEYGGLNPQGIRF
jgi:hypothetical protein